MWFGIDSQRNHHIVSNSHLLCPVLRHDMVAFSTQVLSHIGQIKVFIIVQPEKRKIVPRLYGVNKKNLKNVLASLCSQWELWSLLQAHAGNKQNSVACIGRTELQLLEKAHVQHQELSLVVATGASPTWQLTTARTAEHTPSSGPLP